MAKGSHKGAAPASAQMKHAWALFEAGDIVGARREARKVLASSPEGAEVDEARALLERTRMPRAALYLAGLAAALILVMLLFAIARH